MGRLASVPGWSHLNDENLGFPNQALALVPFEEACQHRDFNFGIVGVNVVAFAMAQEDTHKAVGIHVAGSRH